MMSRRLAKSLSLTLSVVVTGSAAFAASPNKPIPGYRCMMLDLTEKQSTDPSVHVQVRSEPSPGAPAVGWASSVVIVKDGASPTNGYLPMLFSTGKQVWILANQVRPFKSVSDPNARCFPVVLPSGLVGISSN
jgi:hypothetical protein